MWYLAALLGGCSSSAQSGRDAGMGAGGAGANPANPDGAADDGAGAAGGAGGTGPAACPQDPVPRAAAGLTVAVNVELTYAGRPVVHGEAFTLPGGGTLTLSNFRFYLSEVELLRDNEASPVDLVTADGAPAPYNVHLVNAENASAMTFRIAAPAGDYTGMSFRFGLSGACNSLNPSSTSPPLDFASQMTWPPPFGFLFLRYEGVVAGEPGMPVPPKAVAMGGLINTDGAPRAVASGPLVVTGGAGGTVRLRVALDQILQAALLPLDTPFTSGPPAGDEIELGEHVRQNATKVPIFSLIAGP